MYTSALCPKAHCNAEEHYLEIPHAPCIHHHCTMCASPYTMFFTTLHTCAQLKTECVQVTTLSFKIMVVLQKKHGVWWCLLTYCSAQKSTSGGTGGLPCSVFCIRNTNQLSQTINYVVGMVVVTILFCREELGDQLVGMVVVLQRRTRLVATISHICQCVCHSGGQPTRLKLLWPKNEMYSVKFG